MLFRTLLASIFVLTVYAESKENVEKKPAILWQAPRNIKSRNLVYGVGGKQHAPGAGPFVFVEEDKGGTTPKFIVEARDGTRWKVKVGHEARPETSATRFVWAIGYSTDQDYFLSAMHVSKVPAKLGRGASKFVSADGIVHDGRWERMGVKKIDQWRWKKNPFDDSLELDGLRVMMALLNNFDLKDSQNSIYETEDSRLYVVSDLGATFGRTGTSWPGTSIRGDVKRYGRSDFIQKVTDEYVDFAAPSWPMLGGFIPAPPLPYSILAAPVTLPLRKQAVPNTTFQRWIGKRIPIGHVYWVTDWLAQLSPEQIRDAFRAADYSPSEVEEFGRLMEKRIADLKSLRTREAKNR